MRDIQQLKITIEGVPGSGKSVLAEEIAHDLRRLGASVTIVDEGARSVPLSALRDLLPDRQVVIVTKTRKHLRYFR